MRWARSAAQPVAARGEFRQRARGRGGEFVAQRRGQIGARRQGVANLGVVAEALEQSPQRARPEVGVEIVGKRDRRLAPADFRQRRRDSRRQARPPGDGALGGGVAGRGEIDEFGLGQQRRPAEHHRGDVGLVGGERQHDRARRLERAGERLGERAAHQSRWVVEHRGEAELGLGALVGRKIGIKVGPRQGARRFGALPGVGPLPPGEESAHDPRLAGVERQRPFGDRFDGSDGRLGGFGERLHRLFIADLG